jgi:hypothetical protein
LVKSAKSSPKPLASPMTVPANDAKTGHLGGLPLAVTLPVCFFQTIFTKSEPEPK